MNNFNPILAYYIQELISNFKIKKYLRQYDRPRKATIHLLVFIVALFLVLNILIFFNFHKKTENLVISDDNFSNCKLCDFSPVNSPNSTDRDAIFMMLTRFGAGSERLIRSLRTTGSRAKIVIFTPYDVSLPNWVFDCGVIQVKSSPFTARIKASPYKMRWEWYYEYLKENVDKYDRIFHTDAFDAFFFGDPFVFAPDHSGLYFQMEDKSLRSCPYNKMWILACHFDMNRKKMLTNTIACSGSLLGGAQSFLKFNELLVTHNEWPLCWGKGFDQGDFNYILYQFLPQTDIKIYKMNCNSGFMTYNYCVDKNHMFNEKNQPITPNGTLIAYAHQYNRYKDINDHVISLCHV